MVISSYSSRTLLGAPAFCPQQTASNSSSSKTSNWLHLTAADIQAALEQLQTFDVVLELGSPALIDISVSRLLGWSGQMFSSRAQERRTPEAKVLTWQQLHHLAMQEPPAVLTPPLHPQQHSAASAVGQILHVDVAKRMIAEVRVRKAYDVHGVQYIITPLLPGHKPPHAPPAAAQAAAVAVLQQANQSRVKVVNDGTVNHAVVHWQYSGGAAAAAAAAGQNDGEANTNAHAANNPDVYHIWPRHGVVLDEQQYQMLLELTAADQQLYENAKVLQLLDAAWLESLEHHNGFKTLFNELFGSKDGADCGISGS